MTFLWLWAFALKLPISIICGVALAACLLTFAAGLKASNTRSGDGRGQMIIAINLGIFFAVLWAAIYALPSPTYNVVYKDRVVVKQVPVVKRVIAVKQTITRTVTSYPTLNNNIAWCLDNPHIDKGVDACTAWAKNLEQPRVIFQKVPVYSGVRVVAPARDQRVNECMDRGQDTLKDCTDWAIRMELPQQVQVRIQHDSYADLFKKCSDTGSLEGIPDVQAAQLRNQRSQICSEMAFKGSR